MGAPIGNEYWKLRSSDGRDKIFPKPKDLMEAANEYFAWIEANPLKEQQVVKYKDSYEIIELDKMRPLTIHGLCNFIDIAVITFDEYGKRKDFTAVHTRIRQIIYNQKFEGAASGFLNPSIIARDLGLADKKEIGITEIKITAELDE
jgi:hypothetical protein